MIRALRPTDLPGLALFLRHAGGNEITAHTWPKVQPESGHLPFSQVVWQSLGQPPMRGRAWVAEHGGAIVGLAAARARYGGLVWDVEHLHLADVSDEVAGALLDHVCDRAIFASARRVFMDTRADAFKVDVAQLTRFERYTTSSVYRIDAPFKPGKWEHFEGRPRLRADEQALFRLYNAAVPAVVRAAEAMSYEEWSALHRGRKRWTPSLVGDRHQFVWELGEGLAGWLEVVYGQKSQFIELLVDAKYESLLDRFIAYGLKQVSEKAAVYSTVREYQPGLAAGLERVGFNLVGRNNMYVRQLTERVLERKLVPAKVLGG